MYYYKLILNLLFPNIIKIIITAIYLIQLFSRKIQSFKKHFFLFNFNL